MPRRSLLRIAYSPVADAQAAFGTPLSNGALTAVFNARNANHVERVEKVEDLFDCTGQYVTGEEVLTRYGRLVIDFEVEIQALGVLTAYCLGVAASPTGTNPYTHALSPVGATVHALPLGTYIIGFADGDDDGVVLSDAVVNSLSIISRNAERLTARAEIIGNGALPAASGFTFPDCAEYSPLRITDGALTLDGENLLSGTDANHTARSAELQISNNLLINDHPFPLASLDIKRLERADIRTFQLNLGVEGRLNDTLHAKARDRQTVAAAWRIGATTSGVTYTIPSGLLKPNTPPQTFEGEAALSVLQMILRAKRIPGNAATPMTASVVNASNTAFLG